MKNVHRPEFFSADAAAVVPLDPRHRVPKLLMSLNLKRGFSMGSKWATVSADCPCCGGLVTVRFKHPVNGNHHKRIKP